MLTFFRQLEDMLHKPKEILMAMQLENQEFKNLYFSYFQLLYVSPFEGTILSTAFCRIWSYSSVKFTINFARDSSSKFQK